MIIHLRTFLLLPLIAFFTSIHSDSAPRPKLLIFSKTAGFHHSSIPNGIEAITKMAQEHNMLVDTTTDSTKFTFNNLKQYAAVIFLNTTGNVLDSMEQLAFIQYIHSGKGFVGVHAATDTEYDWPWYGNLVGAYFKSHPKQQEATLHVVDRKNIATRHLPETWRRKDEWYNFKWIGEGHHVLITIDEKSYTGGENGDSHPMSWYHEFDGGRSFYTELGHTEESYSDPLYLKHLWGGILYAVKG